MVSSTNVMRPQPQIKFILSSCPLEYSVLKKDPD